MAVGENRLMAIIAPIMPLLMDALAGESSDGDVSADDIISFHALGIALILDNDTHLHTPRDRRLAAETAKKHVERWVKALGDLQQASGVSALSRIMGTLPAPANVN